MNTARIPNHIYHEFTFFKKESFSTMSTYAGPTTIMEYEQRQIEMVNATNRQPVVFIHGLWLLPSSWNRWAEYFEAEGYAAVLPGWPDDPETVEEANAHPEAFAHKGLEQIAEHFARIISGLKMRPAIIGHSFGGLLAQMIAGRSLSAATVAIDAAPFRGVLPLPFSEIKSTFPVLRNPLNRERAIPLTADQFRYAFANAVSEEEARELYAQFAVPGAGKPLFQSGAANLNPWTEAKVDVMNPDRGPLLLISGNNDHTVPWAITHASYEHQKKNVGITEVARIPGRGHSLTIDAGWRDVAQTSLEFIRRFV